MIALNIPLRKSFLITRHDCRSLNIHRYGIISRHDIPIISRNIHHKISNFILNAKKKGSKLVSDDFLALLDLEEKATETESGTFNINCDTKSKSEIEKTIKKNKDFVKVNAPAKSKENINSQSNSNANTISKLSKKDKKFGKLGISLDNLDIFEDAGIDSKSEASKNKIESSIDMKASVGEPAVVDDISMTAEQKVRKDRPPSRIRFSESSQPDYVMISLEKVGLVLGNNVILKNATLSVCTGERVGLVGPNGGGKTTQLRILSGEVEPTTGDVVKSSRNMRISFLRQEFIDELDEKRSLREELRTALIEEKMLLKNITALEDKVGITTEDPQKMEEVLNNLASLQEQAISRGAYSLDSKIDKVMDSIGFSINDHHALVETFSGGWKMRIGLAKILLQEPNILLLDEPTNHLDLDSVYWLEDFLTKQNIPMVIVSHDREFLDRVCNKIVEVENGVTYSYLGNYSKYLDQRRARLEVWKDQYEKQSKYIKEEENWIKKAKNDPSMTSSIRSREIALQKLKNSDDIIPHPPKNKKFRFRFPPAPRCGANLIECCEIAHGYDNDQLFKNVGLAIGLGDRVGFVGPNGSGKSTLMRIMAIIEDPKKGYCEHSGNVVCNYFEQNQADALDLDKTVLATISEVSPSKYSITDIRTLLGQFMFKGDDVDKVIRSLSGGEKARVALCKMMLTPANLLLLDEPTNHLDIISKEVLEEALQHYDGAVVVISHDRYFMSQVVNKIFVFHDKTVTRHDMDYHDYMEIQGDAFKEKVTGRYVEGDSYRITNAKPVIIEQKPTKTKNFGGSGVTSGNLFKGIKNAKRFT